MKIFFAIYYSKLQCDSITMIFLDFEE